jgi:serine/threonine protein kinase
MKLCPSCNHANREEAIYCNMCGTPLVDRQTHDLSLPSSPLKPGMLIRDRYTVVKQIGESGLGRVFLASDASGRRYAIKQIREFHADEDIADYQMYIRSFQREAKILSSLPHPYLPIARDFLITPKSFLIVMDYIEGRTLFEIMAEAENPLPENRVLLWAIQVCEALSYLHSKKPPIIHRNIKPKNIMLEEGDSEKVRLVGFGLARFYVEGLAYDEDCLGTPGYSPPEQYGSAQTDACTDVYGLGATMYELLTKHDPGEFVRTNESGELWVEFPDIHTLNPLVSQRTADVVMKALQMQPQDRFQSAGEMKTELEEILYQKQSSEPVEEYRLNQPVSLEETRTCEFKEVKASDPTLAIKRIIEEYVVAYLNSEGGRIFWGIRDEDRTVVGVKATYRQRDLIRRLIIDKMTHIQPAVAPTAYRVNFHEVLDGDQLMPDLYVIEVIVPKPLTNFLYFTSDNRVFVKTDSGKKQLTGPEIQDEIIWRLQRGVGV